uniref:hypothetical protein n=1 Tax=Cupriavidus taiwanensis TaxID=164546 RepID=UPI0011C07C18|nr:hypothetical protein [Cupriavidus taiwanensis]
MELDLAYAAERLLDENYMPLMQAEQIASLTRLGAMRRGILRDGKICYRTLDSFLGEMAVTGTFNRLNFGGVGKQKLDAVLRGREVIRQPLRMILLLRGLYGTWSDVVRAADVPENISLGPEPKLVVGVCGKTAKRIKAAQQNIGVDGVRRLYGLYLAARKENPCLKRTELMKLLPSDTRYLLSSAQRDAADLEALGDIEALDATMTSYICTRAEIVRRRVLSIRLTPHALLEGHPLAGAWPFIRKFLPAAAAAMRDCVERNEDFQRRQRNAGPQKCTQGGKQSSCVRA